MKSKRANNLNGSDWAKYSISVWSDIRKSTKESRIKHPAMFPEMLINRLISCFTINEELRILDPFMGSGSTVIAACNMGRHGIGFELSDDYIKLTEQRLSQQSLFEGQTYEIYHKDAKEISNIIPEESIDMCITSPPYWDILLQKRTADYKDIRNYGDNEGDLGVIKDYTKFIEALKEIFAGIYRVLKPNKYCIINVMDLRKKDQFYPLHMDVAIAMRTIGYLLDDIIIWDRRHEYNNLRSLGFPSVFRLNKTHEYILIFKKPNI